MEAMILDRNFATQAIIDSFESFIWTERYTEPGDFEIYMPVSKAPLEYIKRDYYIWIRDSDRLQIIEDMAIATDAEDGDHITITGRTLESILDRRIVYAPTTIDAPLQEGLRQLINENMINPSNLKRKIDRLRFVWNNDARISELRISNSFFGESILDVVQTYCELYELGFKIIYNEEADTFDFSIYYGEDRSYNQDALPWVVFSSQYENLIGSNYFESYKNLKTAAVIASGNSDSYGREIVDIDAHEDMVGLDRREAYVDGDRIRWNVDAPTEPKITDYENDYWGYWWAMRDYNEALNKAVAAARETLRSELVEAAESALAETYITKTFEGEIEAVRQYVYGVDFFIGDVVQVRNQYGKEASSRITEIVRSQDISGYKLTPTFTTLIGSDNEGNITDPDL